MTLRMYIYSGLLTVILLALQACGNKGDLYRPEPVPAKTDSPVKTP